MPIEIVEQQPTAPDERPNEDYGRFAPLFVELAALPPGSPAHARLRERLVNGHLPVARNIARRFTRRGEPLADLEQVGVVGLIHAVDRFEPDRGTDFLAFAVPTITGEIRRYFRDHSWATRVPRRIKELHLALAQAIAEESQRLGRAPTARELARHLALTVEEVIEGLGAGQAYSNRSLDGMLHDVNARPLSVTEIGRVDTGLEYLEDREALAPLLAALPPRERAIISLRFFGDHTQSQIADQLGISQMHVSRILSRTLAALRQQLEAD